MKKYILFIPKGGLNDCLCNILRMIRICRKHNRILLLNMKQGHYKINFNDFFEINNIADDIQIIYDFNEIKSIVKNNNLTVYPNYLNGKLVDILDEKNKVLFKCGKQIIFCDHIPLKIPQNNVNEDIIFHVRCGGGFGYALFKELSLKKNIKDLCNSKIKLLENNNYLSIQVRNTDRKCNYKKLYYNNKDFIHSFEKIYIATDDKLALDFFKSKELNVFNFNIFPSNKYKNLHCSNIDPITKMNCLIYEIFIIINSKYLLSNSIGGFIDLLRTCFKNKKTILQKLD